MDFEPIMLHGPAQAEVPLVLEPGDVKLEIIDPGDILARRCVAVCMGWEPLPHGAG